MRSRWLIGLLAVSILLNLVLIGFAIGRHSGGGAMFDPVRGYPHWVRTLPEERKEELRPLVVAHLRSMRGDLRALRRNGRQISIALRADPFDAEALANALQQMRTHHGEVQLQGHRSLVDLATQLTSSERQALADYLQRHPERHRRPPKATRD